MNAFGYIRVSGASQVDKDGPERQAGAILAFLQSQGWSLFANAFEAAVTGTTTDRPEFFRLLEQAQSGDCIVVERLDRLARDLMVQEFLLQECREKGVKLYAADQGLVDLATNDGDPTRKLIRQVLGALAEWEKSTLVLKMKKARDRIRAETGRCEGPKPFGATPQEAIVLETARTLRAKGYSFQRIATALDSSGFVPRMSKKWSKSMVGLMLTR